VIAGLAAAAATAWSALIASGGLIALWRDALENMGRPYASSRPRESAPNSLMVKSWSLLERCLPAPARRRESLDLRPGEVVEIRTYDEILSTLDQGGTLNGVPFMPEMAVYCGTRARVLRRVDKLHDWVNNAGLKRLCNVVLLEGLRCAGVAHGGCQANCHIRWCEPWLRRVSKRGADELPRAMGEPRLDLKSLTTRQDSAGVRYVCQATLLAAGGTPLKWSDPRHYLRDLLSGNVRLLPFLTGVALACFNSAQSARGGVTFPRYATGATNESPHEGLGLQPGELVRVKPKHAIGAR
jgi:hypothetical protein